MPGISRRSRVYLEITLRPPGYFVDFLNFALRFCPRPALSTQTQGNSRVSRMEHQTPSVFPGNFRKRKVLGTLCFPFCLPENLRQPKSDTRIGHRGKPAFVPAGVPTGGFLLLAEMRLEHYTRWPVRNISKEWAAHNFHPSGSFSRIPDLDKRPKGRPLTRLVRTERV